MSKILVPTPSCINQLMINTYKTATDILQVNPLFLYRFSCSISAVKKLSSNFFPTFKALDHNTKEWVRIA